MPASPRIRVDAAATRGDSLVIRQQVRGVRLAPPGPQPDARVAPLRDLIEEPLDELQVAWSVDAVCPTGCGAVLVDPERNDAEDLPVA